jgi:hypothetical protein
MEGIRKWSDEMGKPAEFRRARPRFWKGSSALRKRVKWHRNRGNTQAQNSHDDFGTMDAERRDMSPNQAFAKQQKGRDKWDARCPEDRTRIILEECPTPGGVVPNIETCFECGTDMVILVDRNCKDR